MKTIAKALLIILLLTSIISLTACSNNNTETPPNNQETTGNSKLENNDSKPATENKTEKSVPIKGVSLTPKSFNQEDFLNFFDLAKEAGEAITWAGHWQELTGLKGNGTNVVAELAKQYDYIPIIQTTLFNEEEKRLYRPLDETTLNNYKDSAVAYAKNYQPEYLAIGIEINRIFFYAPEDYQIFADLYNQTYDAVKAVSFTTKIFPTFQLESMKGLNGGIFGRENNPENNQWFLLAGLKMDAVGFTTYPGLIYQDPKNIPADHYSDIAKYTDKPIIFTEIGWFSDQTIPGWESDEQEQAKFIPIFFDLTKGLNTEVYIWPFVYDLDTIRPFDTMGLWRKDGTAKPAWQEWLNIDFE